MPHALVELNKHAVGDAEHVQVLHMSNDDHLRAGTHAALTRSSTSWPAYLRLWIALDTVGRRGDSEVPGFEGAQRSQALRHQRMVGDLVKAIPAARNPHNVETRRALVQPQTGVVRPVRLAVLRRPDQLGSRERWFSRFGHT